MCRFRVYCILQDLGFEGYCVSQANERPITQTTLCWGHMEIKIKTYICSCTQPKLDPDYPESNQFHVSKGRVSGSVLGAAVAVRCSCCGACEGCRCLGVCARCKCCGGFIV